MSYRFKPSRALVWFGSLWAAALIFVAVRGLLGG